MDVKTVIHKNYVSIKGKGKKVMLFAHGYGCDQNMWRFVTPAFENEFKIVLFDQVGSGLSDEKAYRFDKYNSLDGYAHDIIELCQALALENIIFVGHSVSGMIGMLAAIKMPSLFDKIIMICPSPCYINDGSYIGGFSLKDINELLDALDSNYLGWASNLANIASSNQTEVREELNNRFCRNNPEIAKHFAKVTFLGDNRKDLNQLTIPTLIIQCSTDIIVPIEVGEYMCKQILDLRISCNDKC